MDESGSELLYDGDYLSLRRRGRWEYAARAHPQVAVIMARTAAGELLLVEQYRAPLNARAIELPAGLVGDTPGAESETVLTAARRELEEETGYTSDHLHEVMRCPTSAGMTDELAIFVRAEDPVRIGDGGGGDSEDITVHAVPVDDIDAWLAARDHAGLAIDPKIFTALYWLLRA